MSNTQDTDHPVVRFIADVEQMAKDAAAEPESDQSDIAIRAETMVDLIRYTVVPVLEKLSHLWLNTSRFQATINKSNTESIAGIGAKIAELDASVTSLSQRLDEAEEANVGYDYDTRLTVEDAEMIRTFVLASNAIAARTLPPGEEQQAIITRGQEILQMIEINTLDNSDEDEAEAEAENGEEDEHATPAE